MAFSPLKMKKTAVKKERIFLDANVLFSAAYGSPGLKRFWESAREGRCFLLASGYVVAEARRNLFDSMHLRNQEDLLSEVEIITDVVFQIPCPMDLPEKDRPVFLAAMAGKADYLITGDRSHFGKYFGQTIKGIKIRTPKDYFSNRP
jgi:predicted nucleic acid-binding protein